MTPVTREIGELAVGDGFLVVSLLEAYNWHRLLSGEALDLPHEVVSSARSQQQ